jgi:hypothetical protein
MELYNPHTKSRLMLLKVFHVVWLYGEYSIPGLKLGSEAA